ncbi:signal peptidase I [bacterium AH-315-J21]|nr:signal peptidase I [bacterium AH-315-J21]
MENCMQDGATNRVTQVPKKASLAVAVLLSVLTPGLGHVYSGAPKRGAFVFVACTAGTSLVFAIGLYLTVVPLNVVLAVLVGIAVFLWPILDAVAVAKKCKDLSLRPAWTKRWPAYLGIVVMVNLVMATYLSLGFLTPVWASYESFVVPGAGMEDTIQKRDFIMAEIGAEVVESIQRGDIVVFERASGASKTLLVKRLVALPHDTIHLADRVLYINGSKVSDPETVKFTDLPVKSNDSPYPRGVDWQQDSSLGDPNNFGPYVLPEGLMFVMGDNRDNSFDSRYFGPVPIENIRAKPALVYWSKDLSRIGLRINSSRQHRKNKP